MQTTDNTLCLVCKQRIPLTNQHHHHHHQYFNLKVSEKSDYKYILVLPSGAYILKLEWYREDWHGSWARMTCKFVKCSHIFYLSMKQKQTYRHRGQTCGCQGGGWVGEGCTGSLGLADANYYIQNEINKFLLYSTGNYIQYPVITYNGKEYEKEYIYINESLFRTPETNKTL